MKFYSTNNKNLKVSLKEAVLTGMPADKGLFMPEIINKLEDKFFQNLSGLSFQEMSKIIAQNIIDDIDEKIMDAIIDEAINFDAPLVPITEKISTLELFHGPTLAFKDFGARFMSRLMACYMKDSKQKLNIIVATSGDTGSAVANGFLGVPNINVLVLYPSGKVSKLQEKQIATLGENITALEVAGTFDDCQKMVKASLLDKDILANLKITSANSINISRLIPQIFYFFQMVAQLNNRADDKIAVCVPSGNFGNLTAGLISKKMGLPIAQFIAATNINDVVPEYLKSAIFTPRPSVTTISNAMDVGNPSNFARILDLYHHDYATLSHEIKGYAFRDSQTREKMKEVYTESGYICDPHGAVGCLGLETFLQKNPEYKQGIFLETAHPAKFKEIVDATIGKDVPIPDRLTRFMDRDILSVKISTEFQQLKDLMLGSETYR
ncbi:MAG: threonine synthase [Candidatus Marinimicrobia bacterium]|nr:threonine synthase [Candidatus Neomarinimicrobiota bacterium]